MADYIADRISERLSPLEEAGFMGEGERFAITENLRRIRTWKANAFLHLDMRRVNMIYHNRSLFFLEPIQNLHSPHPEILNRL
ncbi:MAG: hypothetical protein HFE43_10855 [Oscillospiraceae bacterium]|jgi:hypothetical protein|nr:hypothetical protein [Oscillospiraceae bacterium]